MENVLANRPGMSQWRKAREMQRGANLQEVDMTCVMRRGSARPSSRFVHQPIESDFSLRSASRFSR